MTLNFQVLVVPAFEFLHTITPMPQDKQEFLKLFKNNTIIAFQ